AINNLPSNIDLLANMRGTHLSYVASSGISQIQIGGPALAGQPGDTFGTFDTTNFDLALNNLPAQFGYDVQDGSQLRVSVGTNNTTKIDSLTAYVRDSSTGGTGGVLGAALRDMRLRADGVPSFQGEATSLLDVSYIASGPTGRPVAGDVLYDRVSG